MAELRGESTVQLSLPGLRSVTYPVVPTSRVCKRRGDGTSLTKAESTRVGTLIVAAIYLQLIQNRYMFRSFTVLQCSHQHCVQPVASDVES